MVKLRQNQFYCLSCKISVTCKPENICVKTYKNQKVPEGIVPALKSSCNCGHSLTKFIKRDHSTVRSMVIKYGYC
jgi:hypothetical protein